MQLLTTKFIKKFNRKAGALALYLISLFLFTIPIHLSAQSEKGQVKKYIRTAGIEMYNNNFKKALVLYQRAYVMDTGNAKVAFKLGTCMYSIRKYKKQSLPYFEQARRAGIAEGNYYLGNLYHLNGRFEDAMRAFQDYKNSSRKKNFQDAEVDALMNKCKTAIELVKHPVNVTIENIGSAINTEYPDYVPLISADESVLIFTSRRKGSTGNQLDPLGEYFEDVYISIRKDSRWTVPKNISGNINSPSHDASVALSADGELLFLYRTSKDVLSGDLYVSIFDGKDWTIPQKLPAPINTENYTEPSASLLSEGQTLYFSSNRPGGYGKKDIYRVVKLGNGAWSKALNLGPSINTSEDEDAPFIHPDGKTLYFSSQGFMNMGGYDIFSATLSKGDLLGKDGWSEPENIGYPVNTPDDDIYFVLSADGKRGYYSSDRPGGYGATDIYLIHFSDNVFGLSVYKAMVVAADSAESPLRAKITLFDSATNKVEGIYNTNPLTGKFIMIIKPGREYTMQVESEGYVSCTNMINPSEEDVLGKIRLPKTE